MEANSSEAIRKLEREIESLERDNAQMFDDIHTLFSILIDAGIIEESNHVYASRWRRYQLVKPSEG